MEYIFTIFSYAGWAWTLVLGIYLVLRLRKEENRTGFDVVEHEK